MTKSIKFSFDGGEVRHTSELDEIVRELSQRLSTPKLSLLTNPEGIEGYLDFHILEDKSVEMELWEGSDDAFAAIQIPLISRVIEVAMTDVRDLPLRQKLEDLPIHWLT